MQASPLFPNRYDWHRFWCPRGAQISFADGGYLYDPLAEYGKYHNPRIYSLEALVQVPCLALLGEPGMGKSVAMRSERTRIDYQIKEAGGASVWFDLREFQTDSRLCQKVFQSAAIRSWVEGTHSLHLFLDSLDECLLRVETVAALLIEELRELPTERLFLRIACRTAEWPGGLELGLKTLWGQDRMDIVELAPLRRRDVTHAADVEGIDSAAFLEEVARREAIPLAIKPVTLGLLLNTYRSQNGFPATQVELYRTGCRLLCTENNEDRRSSRRTGRLSAEQRLAVASRIAAVTVFANRYAVWTGVDRGDVPESDIPTQQLCGGIETAQGQTFPIDETVIRETLDTGLFSARGSGEMGWAHQTYAEFLAAQYVHTHDLASAQREALIVHSSDPSHRIVPQLRETAAWLAGMTPEFFQYLTKKDPQVLLRSDVATADERDRRELVGALLLLYDTEQALDIDFDLRDRYSKLAHPALAEQIRPYITDRSKGFVVRRVAIDIAAACKVTELQGDLLGVALDPDDEIHTRENAAHAVAHIGDVATRCQLRPLAEGKVGEDPDDGLKGAALRALWPDLISAAELFPLLTVPKNSNLFGAYWSFFHSQLLPDLRMADLPIALQWVEQQTMRGGFPHMIENPAEEIMLRGWQCLESEQVRVTFVRIAAARMKQYHDIVGRDCKAQFTAELESDTAKRHLLVEELVLQADQSGLSPDLIAFSHESLINRSDIPWLIECLRRSSTDEAQKVWAHLTSRSYVVGDSTLTDAVVYACEWSQPLQEEMGWLLKPIDLNSEESKKLKEEHDRRQEYLSRREQDREAFRQLDPPLKERIVQHLDAFETGDITAWVRLNQDVLLAPDGRQPRREADSDLTALPGWQVTDEVMQVRIIQAAHRYVLDQQPADNKWFGTNTRPPVEMAGYRALRLLLKQAPETIDSLPQATWERWVSIIIAYPRFGADGGREDQRNLAARAYAQVPDVVIGTLLRLIDSEDRDGYPISSLDVIGQCWDDRLSTAVLDKAKSPELKTSSTESLLATLLDHNVPGAKEHAASLVVIPAPQDAERRARSLAVARVLMMHADDAGWNAIWPAIQQDASFGRQLFEATLTHSYIQNSHQRLTVVQLEELYAWLVGQYPVAEDPESRGGTISTRQSLTHLRDGILTYLRDQGTAEAVAALRRLRDTLPEVTWLKWHVLAAEENLRRRTWTPPTPEDLLKLTESRAKRLVESGDELVEVLLESLGRLQVKLTGETSAVRDIWDKTGKEEFRPVDENTYSSYVKRFLDDDLRQSGIVVNREVEIRPGIGSAKGERTDIHVDAVKRDGSGQVYDVITAVIEVKGCWHKDVMSAMDTQLAGQYLDANHYRHGVYLVGWFACDGWDSSDYRKGQVPILTLDAVRTVLAKQASDLSEQRSLYIRAFVMDTALR